jgi:hypothetical protein
MQMMRLALLVFVSDLPKPSTSSEASFAFRGASSNASAHVGIELRGMASDRSSDHPLELTMLTLGQSTPTMLARLRFLGVRILPSDAYLHSRIY